MKRRGKILLTATGLMGIALLALVLDKIQQRSAEPFPGAVVVLDSSEWRARAKRDGLNSGYLWLSPRSVYYTQPLSHGFQVVRHQINTDDLVKTALNPEQLSITLTPNQSVRSLSPDGKTLLLGEGKMNSKKRYLLVPTNGKSKPIVIDSWCSILLWSPDSKSLASTWWNNGVVLKRYDAQTGAQTETNLNVPKSQNYQYPMLTQITPDGKMLCYQARTQSPAGQASVISTWKISEIQQDRIVEIGSYQFQREMPDFGVLSPTGDRILWDTYTSETSFVQKIRGLFQRRQKKQEDIIERWEISDTNGKNRRVIGTNVLDENRTLAQMLSPRWTPDGKGIHFVKDGKLCYLDLPK